MKIAFILVLAIAATVNCYVSYKDYKLYRVTPNDVQHTLLAAWEYEEGIDFFRLTAPNRKSVVLIAPERQKDFEAFLSSNNIDNDVLSEDYEVELENERVSMTKNREIKQGFSASNGFADFSIYWTYDEMETFCTFLANTYPQYVTMETLTFSPEGRRIYAMKVSSGVFGQKPIIGMETGMHAREWAAPPSTLYFLHRLLEDQATRNELLARVDWLIVPMQNPDGYVWSWTQNRMWRQNRRQITPTCIGADLNRNFAFTWRNATLAQPCGSLTYPGPFPLSEPEDFVVDQLFKRYSRNLVMYLSVHTFGDLVLYPWGFSGAGPIENEADAIRVGNIFRSSILAATGKDYLVVNSLTYFGNINGSVDDHMNGVNNSTFTFTLELTDGFNFIYPEERILALSQETFIGYRALGRYVGENYV